MSREQDPAQDILFLALTRPAMVWGVTYIFLVLNVLVTGLAFIWTRTFMALLIAGPVHIVGYLVCLNDPHRFNLWYVRLRYAPPLRTRFFWGANSYRP